MIGPHIQLHSSAAPQAAAGAPIVKQMDGTDYLQIAQAHGALTIFRKFYQDQNIFARNGADVASEVLASLGGFQPNYVELFNETNQTIGDGLDRYIDFTREGAAVIHQAGLKLAGFSFSVGNPPLPHEGDGWNHLIAGNFGDADVVALHEYWNDGNNLDPGSPNALSCALRHRQVDAELGGNHPLFLITECGRDVCPGGVGTSGWRLAGISGDQYVQEVRAYDALISQDPYVIGATVFTVAPDMNRFANFSIDDLVPALWGGGPPPPPPGGGTICDQARAALALVDPSWGAASCDQITQHVCCQDGTLFVGNHPIRIGLCGVPDFPAPLCSGGPGPSVPGTVPWWLWVVGFAGAGALVGVALRSGNASFSGG